MYEDFYQLQADPFRLSPDHRFCFNHSSYGKAKAYMKYALHRTEGFVMITGKPGTGKTTLINDLLDELSLAKVTVAMLVSTQLEADDLLRSVAFSFGLKGDLSHKATIIQELIVFLTRHYQAGRRALLIIDEAQDLSISAMEELRLLTNLQINNQPLLQIFLLGQEELRDLMQGPEMVQGHQRIVAACHLEPLNEEESTAYIRHRLCTVGWNGNPQLSRTIFPIIHKFSLGIPRKINLICSRLFLYAFVEKRHRIGVNDIRIVLTELQQEQLIPSNQPIFPKLKADDFFDLEDDYASEEEQSPASGPTAKAISSPAAPISDLEAPRAADRPINELSTNWEPIEPVANTTAPTQPPTPKNVTRERLAEAPSAPDRATPTKPVIQDDKGTNPRQDIDNHFISLEKAPVAPDNPGPIPSKTHVPKVDPSPDPRETGDTPPKKTPLDYSKVPQIYVAAPTHLAPIKRNMRYWFIALSLLSFLAIGVAFYVKNQASFDYGQLYQQAHQLKTYILSKFSPQKPAITHDKDSLPQQKSSLGTNQKQIAASPVQAAHTEPAASVASVASAETPMISDPAASNQVPLVETTSEKVPYPIEQTQYVDKTETTESSSIDSTETPPAIATTQNKSNPNKIQVRQVLFLYKSMEMQPQSKRLLDEVVGELKDSQYTVARIVGIVDNRGKGSSDYNLSISIQRAKEVARYLSDRGITAERLRIEEDPGPQENNLETSKNQTSPPPERVVEVTVLVPIDGENHRERGAAEVIEN